LPSFKFQKVLSLVTILYLNYLVFTVNATIIENMKPSNVIADEVLYKIAKLKTELLPHQQRVVDRLQKSPGLVVAHGLGTGKTLSSIAAAENEPGNIDALVPASLVNNYLKEVKKHTTGSHPKLNVKSLQGAVSRNRVTPTDLLIVDEAHRARETSTKAFNFLKNYPAAKRLLLTGTPVYNRPSDIAALVNIAGQGKILPTDGEFNKAFIKQPSQGLWGMMPWSPKEPKLKNTKYLKHVLDKWVDYHQTNGKDFPSKTEKTVSIEMSPEQTSLHDYAWNELPVWSRLRLRAGLLPTKKDLRDINAFQSQTRQLSGSTKKFFKEEEGTTPKVDRAITDLTESREKDKQHKAVVYSNYLDTLRDYGKELTNRNIPYELLTGETSQKKRKQMVDDYNKDKLTTLLLSSAGGEGLDLKGTRQLQVLEPHWNEEKLDQVIGRAIRHGSHTHLPPEQRNVNIQRYLTYPRSGFIGRAFGRQRRGVEQVLADNAAAKHRLNQELLDLLEQHPE